MFSAFIFILIAQIGNKIGGFSLCPKEISTGYKSSLGGDEKYRSIFLDSFSELDDKGHGFCHFFFKK